MRTVLRWRLPVDPISMAKGLAIAAVGLLGVSTAPLPPAAADPLADVYKGRTVTIVISSSSGGGYDTLTRAIGRHIGRYIPGNPQIVAQNMPGAGGIVATNYMYNVAPKDGLHFACVQNNAPLEPWTWTCVNRPGFCETLVTMDPSAPFLKRIIARAVSSTSLVG